jgi:glycosyltransferase involved in cell wall biosynthesis
MLPELPAQTYTFLLNPKTHWIGTIGELHPNKGFPYALHAVNMLSITLPNIVYIIIGEGEQRGDILQYVKDESLHNNIFLAGYIPHADHYLKAFDIFLLPSVKEGFPYVLLESAHACIPTIATNVGGIPEIIQHKLSGMLARPTYSKDIQENITYMLKDKYRREKMAHELYRKVNGHFSIKNMLEKTWALYRAQLLKGSYKP